MASNTDFVDHYTVSFQNRNAHYVHVSLSFNPSGDESVFKVPVWTPGSYKLREFSQHFEAVTARYQADGGWKDIEVIRRDKNSWVLAHQSAEEVVLEYDVYCFVNSVRHSFVDERYAFLHGVSAFGYIEGSNGSVEVEFELPEDWKDCIMAAERIDDQSGTSPAFVLANYDELADSPIALGNFDTVEYKSGGVPHTVVMIGKGNYDLSRIREDFKGISDREVELFGDHPSAHYVHFIQNTNNGSGGLEHLNSQTSQMDRWAYTDEDKYKKFLGLIAHEYFHLWNVKRIRPRELGPFDYDKENYTDLLWVAEGVTSYYDDLFLLWTGVYSDEEYYKVLAAQINRYENTNGKEVMSLEESSRLAWVKAYLPHENSHNTTISYYNKGMLVALLLDLKILELSKGEKSMDDLLRSLWSMYKARPEQGFSLEEFIESCSQVAGTDMDGFLRPLLSQTGPMDYSAMSDFAFELTDKREEEPKLWLGLNSSESNKVITITKVHSNSPAEKAGLSVGDELISMDGWRLEASVESQLKGKKEGDVLQLLVNRDGKMMQKEISCELDPTVQYSIAVPKPNKLYECWRER